MNKTLYLILLPFLLGMVSALPTNGQVLLEESFSTYTGNAPDPAGWNEMTGIGDLTDEDSGWDADEQTYHSAPISAEAGFSSWNSDSIGHSWLISPSVDLTQNGGANRLRFFWKGDDPQLGTYDTVKVMISADGGSSFEQLTCFNEQISTEWVNQTITLSEYGSATNAKIAFYFRDDSLEGTYTHFYLDDVAVEAIPAHDFAVLPQGIAPASFSDTTVFAGDAVTPNMMITNNGTTEESTPIGWLAETGSPLNHEENSAIMAQEDTVNFQFSQAWTAPAENGHYSMKIFTNHTNDAFRGNDTARLDLTVYSPYQQFIEDFEHNGEWPMGWRAMPEDSYSLIISEGEYYAHSGNYSIKFSSYAEAGFTVITPAMELSADATYRLTTFASGSTGGEVVIGRLSEFMDTTSFEPVDTITLTQNYTYQAFETELQGSGIMQIAYRYKKTGEYVYLDDISLEENVPYAVEAQALDAGVSVAEGHSYRYRIRIKNKGTSDGTFNLTTSGSWQYAAVDDSGQTLSDITLAAEQTDTLFLKVTAPTDITDTASDTGMLAVTSQQDNTASDTISITTTAYEAFSAVSEDFEDSTAFPMGWVPLDPEEGNVNLYSSEYSAHSGTNYISFSNAAEGTLVGLMAPALEQASLYRLQFYHNGSGKLVVGTTPNPGDLSSVDTLGTFTSDYEYVEREVTFSAENPLTYPVFLHETDGSYNTVKLDDVSIEKVSPYSVSIPYTESGTALPAGYTQTYKAKIKNTGSVEATFQLNAQANWDYAISNYALTDTIDSITISAQETDSLYVKVAIPETVQDGATDSLSLIATSAEDSQQADTASIVTTAYNPVTHINEGFEQSYNLPLYWSSLKFDSFSQVHVNTYSGYESQHTAEIYESNSAQGHSSFLITPVISNANNTYRLSFFGKAGTAGEVLTIGTLNDPEDTATFAPLDTISLPGSYTDKSLDFTLQENAAIAFATLEAGNSVYLDSIQVFHPPQVSITPEDEATGISVDTVVQLHFNKPMQLADSSALTADAVANFVELRRQSVNGSEVPYTSTINSEKTRITLIPDSSMQNQTTYFLSLADSALADTSGHLLPAITSSFTTADVLPPLFTNETPKITDTTKTGFTAEVSLNEAGEAAYVVVASDASRPTPQQVFAGENYQSTSVIAAENFEILQADTGYQTKVTGLSPLTDYKVYFAARDDEATPNIQDSARLVTVTTPGDTMPPDFIEGYPAATSVTDTSFVFKVQLSEAGIAYYLVTADGAAAPTPEEVKANSSYGDVTPVKAGHIALKTLVADSAVVTGLEANTNYDIYTVAEDSATSPNLQESPVMQEVQTAQITAIAPVQNQNLEAYPNPVENNLYIKSNQALRTMAIYNIHGKRIKRQKTNGKTTCTLQLNTLKPGIYFLELIDTSGNRTLRKIIKQ